MIRTLLIDGTYLMKLSILINDNKVGKNKYIHSTYTFLTKIRKLLSDNQYDKVFIAWDGISSGKYRHDIYNEYKSNRENKSWYDTNRLTPQELNILLKRKEDFLYIKQKTKTYLQEFFFRQCEIDYIEADDIIAQYCFLQYENELITIFTSDRDVLQLLNVSKNIQIIFQNVHSEFKYIENDYLKTEKVFHVINQSNFSKFFDFHYGNAVLLKMILGDSSDNIHKIKNVTEKKLFEFFPELKTTTLTLDYILEKSKLLLEDKNTKQTDKKVLIYIINGYTNYFFQVLKNYTLYNSNGKIFLIDGFNNLTSIGETDKFVTDKHFLYKKYISKNKDFSITFDEYFKSIEYDQTDLISKLVFNIIKEKNHNFIYGEELYKIYEKIIDSRKFPISKDKIEFINEKANNCLSYYKIENDKKVITRGSKFIMEMMINDNMMSLYQSKINENFGSDINNKNTFQMKFMNYLEPFLNIPLKEKHYFDSNIDDEISSKQQKRYVNKNI